MTPVDRRSAGRRSAGSLVELLVSLALLGLLLPSLFHFLAGGFRAMMRLKRVDALQYGAQWALSHFPDSLRAAPPGGIAFRWETKEEGPVLTVVIGPDSLTVGGVF